MVDFEGGDTDAAFLVDNAVAIKFPDHRFDPSARRAARSAERAGRRSRPLNAMRHAIAL